MVDLTVHPDDRVEELNWSRQMTACLDNDDDAEPQQSLFVKQIGKEKSAKIKDINFEKNSMKINDMH